MLYLHFGDRLPSVGIIQRLINECAGSDARCAGIERLDEDGLFGPRTFAAVRALQRALQVSPANGVVEPPTWRALAALRRCKIVDVTDLALETLFQQQGELAVRQRLLQQHRRGHPDRTGQQIERAVGQAMQRYQAEIRACRSQHDRFVAAGGEPIGITDVERPFDAIRRGLEARSRDGSRIVLLRFTGHGSPARQGVAGSLVHAGGDISPERLDFRPDDPVDRIIETLVLGGMTMPMAPFGCVELHGCSVAASRRVSRGDRQIVLNGPAFVQSFANTIQRPVSASTIGDSYGNLRLDTRYEGPVVSCVPGGGDLRDWFNQH